MNATPILGLKSCQDLNLVKRVMPLTSTFSSSSLNDDLGNISTEYEDLFNGIGLIEGKHHITLNKDVIPVVHPPRRIPVSMRDKVKLELDRLESEKIIAKVDYSTDWVNSLVIVRKPNGGLRLCLDPKDLNIAIKREHYPLPTIEDITTQLQGAKYFSILDAFNGFYQIQLDKSSSDLCVFNTPWGRYKFLRMPFGIKSAPEVFHKKFKEIFEGITGINTYIDDLLVWGSNKEEHDFRLKKVFERAKERNVKFNLSKCKFGLTQVAYMGHVLSAKGISVDDNKITAISKMQTPINKKDVERFLGLITYVGKFIPNLSERTAALRVLLKKDVEWHWQDEQEKAFNDLKQCLINKPILQFYDVNKPVTISVDSSQNGCAAVLLQNDLPVAYASRAYTDTQKRYANIEKEMYAVLFGCERFHEYIYGKSDVTIESDHKPLSTICKKTLHQCPARLQRMLIRLQKYDFNLIYRPGKTLFYADTLSRAYVEGTDDHVMDIDIEAQIFSVVESLPMSKNMFTQFQNKTKNDNELNLLRHYICNGWPCEKTNLEPSILKYWQFKDEITLFNDCLFRGDRLIVPVSLRNDMLQKIHYAHLGIEKSKNRARELLFWPGMSNDITNMINKCDTCLKFRNSNSKEPLFEVDLPDRPWEKVSVDIFNFNSSNYLLIVDSYSKYIELSILRSMSAETVISEMKSIFSRHGIPSIVLCDSGSQFTSNQFKEFSKKWDFQISVVSPKHSQGNGFIERNVQTVKRLMKKCKATNSDLYLALLELRCTPASDLPSPAQLLMGRRLRSVLPMKPNLLKPKVFQNTEVKNLLKNRQNRQKYYFDRNCKNLKPLKVGDNVRYQTQPGSEWVPARVVSLRDQPRSYLVKYREGNSFVRNRKHIIKVPATDFYPEGEEDIIYNNSNNSSEMPNVPPYEETINTDIEPYKTRYGRVVNPPRRLDL